jgi:hypothetical protein
MQTIWKYPVTPTMELDLPSHAQILTIALQHGEPQMWVLLDPEAPCIPRTFAVYGTGDPIEDGLTRAQFCGTYQMKLVYHVFETTSLRANAQPGH